MYQTQHFMIYLSSDGSPTVGARWTFDVFHPIVFVEIPLSITVDKAYFSLRVHSF